VTEAGQFSNTPPTRGNPGGNGQRDAIRVLLIAPSLQIVGGQSVQAHRLLQLFSADPTVIITFCSSDSPLPEFIRHLKYVRTVANLLTFLPRVLLSARKCDVLHVFTPAYVAYFLWTVPAMLAGRLLGKRVILNYRDGRGVDHMRESALAVRTLRLADAIVTPSGYLVHAFAEHGVQAQTIPNFLDPARFHYRERNPLRPVFFTNRGLEPLYNVDCVLRAFAGIQKRYPEAQLTVAHDGPCRPALEELARTLGLANVVFTGKVSQARMIELYDAADVYLMSPNIDNMPGTLLECFASGIPIVSTNAGGVPYIVENEKTGLLVPCGDHEALAAAACRLLEHPEFALALARNAHAECARYTGTAILPQWQRLYAELSGKPLPAPGPVPA
jgi:glycosyltransferase involved in cell wall biosynthesis